MNQYVKQYQKSSIETASREQILIMLYDGAIQFLNKAKIAMQNKEIEATHNNLMGAQNIIQEFINSLDREVAPQLAENLTSLYEYFIRRLIHANIKREMEPIDEVLKYLKSLKGENKEFMLLGKMIDTDVLALSLDLNNENKYEDLVDSLIMNLKFLAMGLIGRNWVIN